MLHGLLGLLAPGFLSSAQAATSLTQGATLREFATLAEKISAPSEHPLAASSHQEWSPSLQDSYLDSLSLAEKSARAARTVCEQLETTLGAALTGTSLLELAALAKAINALGRAGRATRPLLESSEFVVHRKGTESFLKLGQERDELRTRLDESYTQDLHHLNLTELALKLRTWSSAFVLIRFFMLWATRSLLKSVRKDVSFPGYAQLLRDVEGARELSRLSDKFDAGLAAARQLLPELKAESNDWSDLFDLVERTQVLRTALDELHQIDALKGEVLTQLLSWAETSSEASHSAVVAGRQLTRALDGLNASLCDLETLVSLDPRAAWNGCDATLEGLCSVLSDMKGAAPELRDWTRYQRAKQRLLALPEGVLVRAYEEGSLHSAQIKDAFNREYTQKWVSHEYSADPLLEQFDGTIQSELVESFRADDVAVGALAARQAHARLAQDLPRGADGEMAVLRRELTKQKKHMPIRKLFREIPTVRRRLKPCLLMSPLSVAQYLSASESFDMVIFDEASQLPTPDAVGAIARSKQLIVVGDSKQLPPTAFFAQSDDDDGDNPDTADEVESILDECIASQMQDLPLRWHYRSQHEHLIAFSNSHYYDDKLFTFASAEEKSERLGVSLVPVHGGYYEKGKSRSNRGEAEALVAEVVRRLRDREESRRSIGIVTFSKTQQQLVEDLLEVERSKHPDIEQYFGEAVVEPVFVKNLENVQGDERDVILFSICYGPDQHGKVSMTFGPLNRDGGERRLNVAVTRARQQLVVFSTLTYDQVDLTRSRATGVKHLRRFLQYAKDGPRALAQAIDVSDELRFDSPFEEEIYEALRKRGHRIATQVGCSGYRIDLAVVDPERPGRFLLGVECDGAAYHSAKTARDRDRLRQSVLESLGWRLHRIWSTDWWTQPEAVMKRLEAAIEDASAAGPREFAPGANDEAPESLADGDVWVEAQVAAKGLTPPPPVVIQIGEDYIPAQLNGNAGLNWDSRHSVADLARDLREIVSIEAPVHLKVVGARLATKWDISKVSVRVQRELAERIWNWKIGMIDSGVVWASAEQRAEFRKVRHPTSHPGSERKIDEIPIEELLAAARLVLEQNLSVERDEFTRSIARVFGIKRCGTKVIQVIDAVVSQLIASGQARTQGDSVALPN